MGKRFSAISARLAWAVLALAACATPAVAAELTAADYTAIQQLYARYNTTLDRGDAAGWAATFTADGVFVNQYKGTEALQGFVNTQRAGRGPSQRHFSADLVITATADGATATVSTLLIDLSTKPASISAMLGYNDVLVKTAAGWRFKSRGITPQTAPAAAPAAAAPAVPAR
jgi:uncharacterized protein (TIGR02246 family)